MAPATLPRVATACVAILLVLCGTCVPARADWDSARKYFLENVKNEDWKVRRNTYGALQDFDSGASAELILANLAVETHPGVQAAAIDILGRFKSQEARESLLGVYRKGKPTERGFAAAALATVKGADVDAALVEALASGPTSVALQSALALGTPGRAGAVPALLAAVNHPAWQVRAAAARSLGALAEKSAVAPLAARLKAEKFRARAEIVRALEAITGQKLGDAPLKWAAVAAGADPAAVKEEAALPPTFFGVPVTGERVAFVLDRSLNMRDEHPFIGPENRERLEAICTPPDGDRIPWRTVKTKMHLAVGHIKHAVDGMPSGSKVEVVWFAEDVKAAFAMKLTSVGAATRKALYAALDALDVDDGINMYGALDAALDLGGATDDKALKAGPDQILLVTNNVPTKGDVTDADAIASAIALKARRRFVPISVVGIGNHPFALAEALAKKTGGAYVNLSK